METAPVVPNRLAFVALGAAQGIVYWRAYAGWPEAGWLRSLLMGVVVFVSVLALSIEFAWSGRARVRLVAIGSTLGFVLGAAAIWVWSQVPPAGALYEGDELRQMTWWPGALLVLYVIAPYVQIYQHTGRFWFPYPELFRHAWRNVFIGAAGLVYAGVFHLLMQLWAGLFAVLGIRAFSDFFSSAAFISITSPALFAYGVASIWADARVVESARAVVLAVFRSLFPVLSVIAVLFTATLPISGIAPLWQTGHASPLLLMLVGAIILFLNAVFEDGTLKPPYPRAVRVVTETAVIISPILAALALYSTTVRVEQYGLTPDRFLAVVFAAVAGLYGCGYALETKT